MNESWTIWNSMLLIVKLPFTKHFAACSNTPLAAPFVNASDKLKQCGPNFFTIKVVILTEAIFS